MPAALAQTLNQTTANNNTTFAASKNNTATTQIPATNSNNVSSSAAAAVGTDANQLFDSFHAQGTAGSIIITGERIPAPNVPVGSSTNMTIEHPPYLVSGNWNLMVINGTGRHLSINFTMVHVDGQELHTHNFTNFRSVGDIVSNNSTELQDGYADINGVVDILENGTLTWSNIPIEFRIEHYNVMNVTVDNSMTDNHFYAQPLYGLLHSLTDENGNELRAAASRR